MIIRVKGQNLVEIGIILVLIAVVAFVGLSFLGKNVKTTYQKSSDKYGTFKPFEWNNTSSGNSGSTTPGTTPGSTPGTSGTSCSGGMCNIDYGDYNLSGIPENFGSFVEVNGSSGGTDKLASLLLQISGQLESKGEANKAGDLKTLAHLAQYISAVEKQIEESTKKCAGSDVKCFEDIAYGRTPGSLLSFPDPATYQLETVLDRLKPGAMSASPLTIASISERSTLCVPNIPLVPQVTPAMSYMILYNKIMATDSGYPATVKNIVKEVSQQIDDISYAMDSRIDGLSGSVPPKYNTIFGNPRNTGIIDVQTTSLDQITNPKSSVTTDLKAALLAGK